MTRATGIGSHPGAEQSAFDEALRIVWGVLGEHEAGLPYLPEVPGRGAPASMTGRTLGQVLGLDADLQPAGWRLTGAAGAPGLDQRRARSLFNQDLDTLEDTAQDYAGDFKVQLAGPWTLAATTELPRGDKVLGDHGARRELAQALAEAAAELVGATRRRVPGARRVIVQLDEPMLAAVRNAQVPTISGFSRLRAIDRPEIAAHLGSVCEAVVAAGGEAWVHSCAPATPWDLAVAAGASGMVVDIAVLAATQWEAIAEAYESGGELVLGIADTLQGTPGHRSLSDRARRWLDTVGLGASERLTLAPACGLAGAAPGVVPSLLGDLRDAARRLDD